MNRKNNMHRVIIASLCLSILVLDTRTALEGARIGIDLCLKSILPSLLPFCILSKIICSYVSGRSVPALQIIGRPTGIPQGAESIFILSFIGGYPIGAQCIDDACQTGAISRKDAARLLAFCNNAGPAFLFGILSCLFSTAAPLWSLYIIHILSALLVGILIPGRSANTCVLKVRTPLTFPQAVEESLKTMALVCGWVVVFRIILQFVERWLFWALDPTGQAIFAGILELSNGCISLLQVNSMGLRYILCAFFLGFGGCCVGLQTATVTRHVDFDRYFPGKLLQASVSVVLAATTQYFHFTGGDIYPANSIIILSIILGSIIVIFLRKTKKVVAIAG